MLRYFLAGAGAGVGVGGVAGAGAASPGAGAGMLRDDQYAALFGFIWFAWLFAFALPLP